MGRVAYAPHLTSQHIHHYIEAHRHAGATLHGQGHFGRWLRKAAGTVTHAITHSTIGRAMVEDGAKALGGTFAGAAGAAAAGNFAHQLLKQHAGGAAPPVRPGPAPAPPGGAGGFHQPNPAPNPTSAGAPGTAAVQDLGFGVPRRRRAPAKKKKAPAKRKPRRPF